MSSVISVVASITWLIAAMFTKSIIDENEFFMVGGSNTNSRELDSLAAREARGRALVIGKGLRSLPFFAFRDPVFRLDFGTKTDITCGGLEESVRTSH
jgi:hypothetical protein